VLLDEWKFRHTHVWTSLRQYAIAGATVSIVPYVKMELVQKLGRSVFLFPFVGWLILVAAALLFAAEYVRCYDAEVGYRWFLGSNLPERRAAHVFQKVAFGSISQTTLSVLCVMSWILSVGNVILLNELLTPRQFGVGLYAFLGGMSVAYLIGLAILRSHFRRKSSQVWSALGS
jgi:hypothetical protein